jgi:NAD(P)-dependent dehydrogenase (short-subunit alcohol dehydrogenase family)
MTKSILITGGTSGIGRAATVHFAAKRYSVFSTYRNPADRAALAAIDGVHPIQLDVTDSAALDRAFETISAALGEHGLYAIVNNAGITHAAPFEFAREELGRQVMEVNVMAPFRISQKFLPLLTRYSERNAVQSRIVNIASWAGALGQPFIAFYNASKFAITGLSESMFYDLGLVGVHVVLASPGVTRTPFLEKTTREASASLQYMPEDRRTRYAPLLKHYAAIGADYGRSPMFQSAEKVAQKLFRVVEKKRPSFKYDLSLDACVVDQFVARFLPWRLKATMNRRIFRLNPV